MTKRFVVQASYTTFLDATIEADTIEQAIDSGRQNVETLTSLLDARFVCGDAALFARFIEARRQLSWYRSDPSITWYPEAGAVDLGRDGQQRASPVCAELELRRAAGVCGISLHRAGAQAICHPA